HGRGRPLAARSAPEAPVSALETARRALSTAEAEHAGALRASRDAANALDAARCAFDAAPSDALEQELEERDRERRRADRYETARAAALTVAQSAFEAATVSDARARRDQLLLQRQGIFAQIRAGVAELLRQYETLFGTVSEIESALARDRSLVERLNEM